jgi:hypothetical protein
MPGSRFGRRRGFRILNGNLCFSSCARTRLRPRLFGRVNKFIVVNLRSRFVVLSPRQGLEA